MSLIQMRMTGVITQPEILEDVTAPDFFAHGAVIRDRGEVITALYYIEHVTGSSLENHTVCRIHYPRTYWFAGLARANKIMGNGVH